MTTLGSISFVADGIKAAATKTIKKFYKIIFENEGDRSNRKRLREFVGFSFKKNSKEYNEKIKYVKENFTLSDLVAVANILHLCNDDLNLDDLSKLICESLMNLNDLLSNNDNDSDDNDDDDGDENDEHNSTQMGSLSAIGQQSAVISFHDVEGAVRLFDGKGTYSASKWVKDIEDLSQLIGWGELHKFIFAKKHLVGVAKIFIQGETSINNWTSLKNALLKEFGKEVNSMQLHRLLNERKIKKDESPEEYFLIMKEIASRGSIEAECVIQYVIDGIKDDERNKIMLYGTSNFNEFKKRLKIYTQVREKTQPKISKEIVAQQKVKQDKIICYSCGGLGHRSRDCRHKEIKCFKCNTFGHKSYECKVKPERCAENSSDKIKVSFNNIDCSTDNAMCKNIKVNGFDTTALIDTGSCANLLRYDEFKLINPLELCENDTSLVGFGNTTIKVIGKINAHVKIDSSDFETSFFVVPKESMNYKAIIGNELLRQAELTINSGHIKVSKIIQEPFIMNIKVDTEEELNIGEQINQEIIKRLRMSRLSLGVRSSVCLPIEIGVSINIRATGPVRNRGGMSEPYEMMDERLTADETYQQIPAFQEILKKQRTVLEGLAPVRSYFQERKRLHNYKQNATENRIGKGGCSYYQPERSYYDDNMLEVGHGRKSNRRIHHKNDLKIKTLLEEQMKTDFEDARDELRQKAKFQIQATQEENKRHYNLRRKPARKYFINDLVAIKKTQFEPRSKLKQKYYGPYKIIKVKSNETYEVKKEGFHDGPLHTSTRAEYMKPWCDGLDDDGSSETDEAEHGRTVGRR